MKRKGTELSATHLKENRNPSPKRWWDISKRLVAQYSRAPVLLSRGFLESKGGRCTIHFNAESSNTELLFRTIHSANQFSICGAVSSWCEDFAQRTPNQKESTMEKFAAKENEQRLKNVKPQEVNSLVQTPRSDNHSSDCENVFSDLKHWRKKSTFTRVGEDATFARRVSIGMSFKTNPDADDGLGRPKTPRACREYTLYCEAQNPESVQDSRTNYNSTSSSSSYYTIS